MLSMLAMEMPFLGHLRGVGGRCPAIGPITPLNRPTSPQIAPLAGCGLGGLVEGLGNAANARKKTPGNGGNG